ncbi:phosphotriesterase family protein [Tropicimonas sediminicola]|uniref:Phosphotriesterase-related protein n=1 Tax=Tropicimonas sediminicola TaxID=1031541 RepID=A0A239F4B0_9RHOB|nr:aryldialkylphosphatase [Tropicimonas sediminicola]SNS50944.1 phosphotriesterase-related protein [Tropicimonas sediminicola]
MIRTVLGDVSADAVGPALMHEHLLFDIVPPQADGDRDAEIAMEDRWQVDYRSNETPANALQTDAEVAAHELAFYAADGGSLVVDQSVHGLARDAGGLARASRASGVHVVASAGTYVEAYVDSATRTLRAAALADRFTREVTEGLDGTEIRAGLIGEIGCSWPLTGFETRALEAAAEAQRRSGAAISVHPGRHETACSRILDILAASGADLSRVILCHMDRTHPDGHGILPLLERGCAVEWDFFGIEQSHYWMTDAVELPTDLGRLRLIREFDRQGFGEQIAISHDICTKTRLRQWGGHGYGHILRNVRALMLRLDFRPPLIDALLRDTPLRLLNLKETPQ